MITQRFNANLEWRRSDSNKNYQFLGFIDLINYINNILPDNSKALEIGSYMGESTKIMAASGIFNEIVCVDPFEGKESFNNIFGYDWKEVEAEFNNNIKYFDFINHVKDYSYNILDNYNNEYFDFVYIDASHEYEDVLRDIKQCIRVVRKGGLIAGHDYSWKSVKQAVTEVFGNNIKQFKDTSWAIIK